MQIVNCCVKALLVYLVVSLNGQTGTAPGGLGASPGIPHKILDFQSPKALLGFPRSSAMGYPFHCSSEGSTFIDLYADESSPEIKPFPDLYKITGTGDVLKVNRRLPSTYNKFSVRDFFAARRSLVSLIYAERNGDPSGKIFSKYILSTSDTGGDKGKNIELDLKFDPLRIAMFDSGAFLVLGMDRANLVPVLAILSDDGVLHKVLDLDAREYKESSSLRDAFIPTDRQGKPTEKALRAAISSGTFTAFGSEILFVQPGSTMTGFVIGEAGVKRSIP